MDELIDDKKLMWKLIDNCWVQKRWSPSVTAKGAFFCEIAGAIDQAFDGEGGYPLVKGWWIRNLRSLMTKCEGIVLRAAPQYRLKDLQTKKLMIQFPS